ncbi:MAG TPA: YhdP family protein [Rhodanobacteraceae bacterium]
MTPWRRHLRRARLALTVLVAVLLIATAVFMGAIQVLLPLATRYPDFVARQLSARLHRPVSFAAISSQWQPSGPLLTVRDLTLGPGQPGGKSITLPHAALKFDFSAWLRPAHRWITLRLSDMELRVEHSASGWMVVGFGSSAGASHASLQSLPVDLDLRNLHVDFVDDARKRSWHLIAPQLLVVNVGDTIRFGGSVRQVGTTQSLRISGHMDATARNFDVHAASRGLDLAQAAEGIDLQGYAVQRGSGDIELWAGWRDGKLASATLRYALRNLVASGPDGRSVDLAGFAGVFQATRAQGGWNLAWRGPGKQRADIDDAGGVIAQLRGRPGAWRVSVAARSVEVGPWLSLIAMAPQAPKALADWATHAKPKLRIDSAAMAWQQGGRYDATIRFSGLRAGAAGAIPGIVLPHGVIRADDQAVSLEVPTQAATLALADVFREPFEFRQFAGTFVAWREDGSWNVAADGLRFDTGEMAGNARAHLTWLGHGRRPFLAAYAAIDRAKVADAKAFWPYRSMPPSLVKWLDHALVGGDVTSGRVLIRGDLGDWPFLDHKGRFEATGVVQNATFDFADDWPPATEVDAAVDFTDNRMGIVATHAKVRGVTTTHAVATIPDLGNGVLGLDIEGGGTGAELLDFVRNSPVGVNAREALTGLSIGGSGKFGIKLSIPLDHAEDFSLAGQVNLARADVTADKWKLKLKNLTGPLVIGGKGFRASGLSATFRGAPATLAMAVGADVADPKDIVEASMQARVSAQTLVQGYPDLSGLVAHARGVAPFQVGVKVAAGLGNAPAVPTLSVKSSLAGIALDFPAPLDKPASTTLPLDLTLQLPPAGAPLAVSLGDVLQVRGRLADPQRNLPTALAMTFGPTPPTSVPARGLVVGGHAARLDVSGWIQQAIAGGSGGAFPQLERADVSADAAQVFGTDLGALHFTFAAGATDDTIDLDGAAVKGTITVPTVGLMTRGITANLQHLYWPEESSPKESGPPTPPLSASPIAPASIPPLHARVGDLKLGNAQLGTTTFESAPTLLGMHIGHFDSKGADFSIRSQGNWDGSKASSVSHMVIDISSQDFGKTLTAFGFSGLLAGGKDSDVHIDGTWPGGPTAFSLAWMEGSLSIKVGEGRILAVKPGLGRVLGLMSLRELPNRLMLHFGDVFKKGFGFDQASATFTLKNGSAYTKDMLITAPAARIAMRGRTGFRNHDYDLVVDVTPHVGGALPVVGAVIGGPVGAAAGLVVQGLIGKGINKAAGSTYRVTGSWDKPKIVTIASPPVPATSAGLPASGASVPAVPAPAASVPAPAGSGG